MGEYKDFPKAIDYLQMDDLPDNVNEEAEKFARQYRDADLMVMLKEARKGQWYGQVNHYDSNGRLVVVMHFQKGICMRANPVQYFNKRNLFKGSKVFYK